jgi:hypothetical protein
MRPARFRELCVEVLHGALLTHIVTNQGVAEKLQ